MATSGNPDEAQRSVDRESASPISTLRQGNLIRRAVVASVGFGVSGGVAAYLLVFFVVNASYVGQWSGLVLPSTKFGVPPVEAAHGVLPVGPIGWDGQFYYYQSNCLFPAPELSAHFDNPTYRYQRIGMPLAARIASVITGRHFVTAQTFLIVQIPFIALGIGALAGFLVLHNLSPIWCLGWAANYGVQVCLLHGQPDPMADSLFIVSVLAIYYGRLWVYVPAASLLCLTREPYFIVVVMVWITSFAGILPWSSARDAEGLGPAMLRNLGWNTLAERLVCTTAAKNEGGQHHGWLDCRYRVGPGSLVWLSVPCLLFLSWHLFLRLGDDYAGKAAVSAPTNILDWPFVAFFKSYYGTLILKNQPNIEKVLKPFFFLVLVFGFYTIWHTRKRSFLPMLVLPYFVVLSLMSTVVWVDSTGYSKALGTVLACIVFTLPLLSGTRGKIAQLILLLAVLTYKPALDREFLGAWLPIPDYRVIEKPDGNEKPQPRLTLSKARFEFDETALRAAIDSTVRNHRFSIPIVNLPAPCVHVPVTVWNESDKIWYLANPAVAQRLKLTCRWKRVAEVDAESSAIRSRAVVPHDVAPGESFTRLLPMEIPTKSGDYVLRITMLHETLYVFDDHGGSYRDVPVSIQY